MTTILAVKKPLTLAQMLGLCGRLLAGGVFIYSGVLKIQSPAQEFAAAIETYKVVPVWAALAAATVLPWLELYLGVFLVAGLYLRFSAAVTGALLVFFELLLAQAWLRGLPVMNCGCFGSGGGNPLWLEFLLNLVWLAAAAAAWRFGGPRSLDSVIMKEQKCLALASVALFAILVPVPRK